MSGLTDLIQERVEGIVVGERDDETLDRCDHGGQRQNLSRRDA